MRLKSPTHQEFTLDPIREEQEISPKQKLARPKASQKFLGIAAETHEVEPSPRETIQSFDKLNSNRLQNSSSLKS